MRFSPLLFALLVTLTSCTIIRPEGVPVTGSVWLVSPEEVQTAVAVARARADKVNGSVDQVIVDSRSEVDVYFSNRAVIDGERINPCVAVTKESERWQ